MTQAGQLLGSPAYMSPEQWQDSHAVDRRTDLWAEGVILFELLTGERPMALTLSGMALATGGVMLIFNEKTGG